MLLLLLSLLSAETGGSALLLASEGVEALQLAVDVVLLANIIDAEKPKTVLGTIAGADTLLVICRSEEAAKQVEAEINYFLK